MAIWRSRKKSPILNPVAPAGYRRTRYVMHCTSTSTSRKRPAHINKLFPRECDIGGFYSLSGKEIRITDKRALGKQITAHMLQGGLTSKDNEYTYTPEERAKMGRYCAGNTPAKTARHFSQLLDSNTIQRGLRRSGYVTFWLRA